MDLPLRVLVREAGNGETLIAFHPARQMLAGYKVSGELLDRLVKSQQLLVSAVQEAAGK